MTVPKANQRAVNKYVKANYDRINVTMPKGKKDLLQTCAQAHNESVNSFINRLISEALKRDGVDEAAEGTAGPNRNK